MENNYSVYQHVTPDGMYYFGQTNDIKRRWEGNGAGYKGTALQPYIEQYGWDNIQHIVLFENQSKEDALWIENFLIETAREDGVCINKNRSGLVSKEEGYDQQKFKQYYEQNKDKILEKQKQYYEQNKDKIKKYREQNKDKKSDYNREYYEQNKDKLIDYKREYYEQNKDKSKEYYKQHRDKIREQQKQYRERKKEEKQFKEFGNLPLW